MSCIISDLSNQRFGRFTVTTQAGRDKWGQVIWNCLCDCGKERVVTGGNLRSRGENQSCGCYRQKHTTERFLKHGHSGSPKLKIYASREYRSWQGMKKRCLDENHVHYKNYGGRGVIICERWINSFENFLSDLGERPVGFTLDRIDVNGNYEPSNCRWASWKDQAHNKRNPKQFFSTTLGEVQNSVLR